MSIDKFFNPKNIACIGVSRDPRKIGHVVFRNFLEEGFEGNLYPVNPNADEILGKKAYSTVSSIRKKIDLAILMVPAKYVPDALEDCGKAGVKASIIITAGFKEIGNTETEEKIGEIAEKYKMRVMGPNCLGVFDPYSGVDSFFHPRHRLGRPKEGSIAFISQSGATASIALDLMDRKGYRASKFISYGNAADVDEIDLINYLSKDDNTSVICAYIEGLKDGRKFMEAVEKCEKPVVVLKAGVSEKGSEAVSSHTGSLAGAAEIYSAAFKQSGAVQAHSMEDLFNYGRTFSSSLQPKGKRVQVITNGGGFGILTVDALMENGLELAEMDKKAVKKLKKSLPGYAIVKNPIDLTGDATAERYRNAINAALDDDNVDIIAVIALLQIPTLSDDIMDVITEAWSQKKKPIFVISAGGDYTEVLKKSLDDMEIPTFTWPSGAARSMKALYDYSERHS